MRKLFPCCSSPRLSINPSPSPTAPTRLPVAEAFYNWYLESFSNEKTRSPMTCRTCSSTSPKR